MIDPRYLYILATVLAALGMWRLLPRGDARGRLSGAALMAVALGLYAAGLPGLGNWVANAVFYVLAAVTVVAAICTVTFRNPVYCAIWFGLSLLGTAGLLLLAGAQFLAVATVVVYAGAILVTFLFVLMLAQTEGRASYDRVSFESLAAAVTSIVILGVLTVAIAGVFQRNGESAVLKAPPSVAELEQGVLHPQHTAQIGAELFGRWLIAVEVAGVLLLAALVGAAVIVLYARSGRQSSGSQQV
jgi:NADH-quinone oxidoreductase subunit J